MEAHVAGPRIARLAGLSRGTLLRGALRLDALVTGANGIAYLAAAGVLDSLLGLPASLLRGAGAFLVLFAAAVWLVAARPAISHRAAGAVIAANAVWAIDSVVALAAGWWSPSTAGAVWIAMQAVVVAAFAGLQLTGLRTEKSMHP